MSTLRSVVPIHNDFNMEQALEVKKIDYVYVILLHVLIVIGSMNLPLPFYGRWFLPIFLIKYPNPKAA